MRSAVERVHPLVDGVVVVSRTDREVVALTPLRSDLLVQPHAAGRRVRVEHAAHRRTMT